MNRRFLHPAMIGLLLVVTGCARTIAVNPLAAGVAAARADRWEEAVAFWQKAVERDPRDAAAHNNLAVASERRGAWEEARRGYEEALRLDPGNTAIKINYDAFKVRLEASRGRGS